MDFADKAGAIGQLWIEFRNDEDFTAFMEYNDIGCPLAYMVAEGLVRELTPVGEEMIIETFKMLLDLLNVTEEELEVLDDVTLGSVLVFASHKKQGIIDDNEEVDPELLGRVWFDMGGNQ